MAWRWWWWWWCCCCCCCCLFAQRGHKPITIADMLSLESLRKASSTIWWAHSWTKFWWMHFFTITHTSSSESTSKTPSHPITTNLHSVVTCTEDMKGSAITNSLIELSPKLRVTPSRPITRLFITIPPDSRIRAISHFSSALWSYVVRSPQTYKRQANGIIVGIQDNPTVPNVCRIQSSLLWFFVINDY